MTKPSRWSDQNARPGCAIVLIAGISTLLTGLWPLVDALN